MPSETIGIEQGKKGAGLDDGHAEAIARGEEPAIFADEKIGLGNAGDGDKDAAVEVVRQLDALGGQEGLGEPRHPQPGQRRESDGEERMREQRTDGADGLFGKDGLVAVGIAGQQMTAGAGRVEEASEHDDGIKDDAIHRS